MRSQLIRSFSRRVVPETLLRYASGGRDDVALIGRELVWHAAPKRLLERWADRKLDVEPYFWLFILGLNNSGTTILSRILETHPLIRSLPHEGQKIGNSLPLADDFGVGRIWGTAMERFHWTESDPKLPAIRAKFDWSRLYDARPGILLEKSPPNSVRARWLQQNFKPSRFIAIVRSPYAVCEGIMRRTGCDISVAARHWTEGNSKMLDDINHLDRCLLIKYEELCSDGGRVVLGEIARFLDVRIPFDESKLSSIDAHSIEGRTANLNNLNGKSISRLSENDMNVIADVGYSVMERLGYERVEYKGAVVSGYTNDPADG